MSKSHADDLKAFQRGAKALLKRIAAYVEDGGGIYDFKASEKTEMAVYRARDKLETQHWRLGESPPAEASALLAEVKGAVKAMPDAARERRQKLRNEEIERLKQEERGHARKMSAYEKAYHDEVREMLDAERARKKARA